MHYFRPPQAADPRYGAVVAAYRVDETAHVRRLLTAARLPAAAGERVRARAAALVERVRRERARAGGIDAFMHEYALSSQEGVALMCLAEALLRVPDERTADLLIRDKLSGGDWERHLGRSESLFVNASAWGLMLSGRVVRLRDGEGVLRRLLQRGGEPFVRQAVRQAMRIIGRQFVMGRSIEEALRRARPAEARGYRYSYDMLGEAARTETDSRRYLAAYEQAIAAIGAAAGGRGARTAPGISVKLSALHPRYQFAQGERVLRELVPRLCALARQARDADIGLTVDAEEADRLDLSLAVFAAVAREPALAGWHGLGLAVQAYQKRAFDLLDWLAELAAASGRQLMLRLVKGAYWDTEIKRAQERGLDGYPVFTRKASTDVSYLACARKLLARRDLFYPQFATHNAHTVAAVLELAGDQDGYEFQRLHGMGEALYDQIVGAGGPPCRVYAPVGGHEDLLPYLVRRLLENGANTSFVNRIVDDRAPLAQVVADPLARVEALTDIPHPRIPLPAALYPDRRNSRGIDLTDVAALDALRKGYAAACERPWRAAPLVAGRVWDGAETAVYDPADRRREIGRVVVSEPAALRAALDAAPAAARGWDRTPPAERAACLERAAGLLEAELPRLVALCTREGGRSIADGVAEVREAVDFCRYYAARVRADFAPRPLPGPTGESNRLELHGRGVFVCISPWNFPLAIFLGQIAAALAAGNAVLAKPAEQTPLVGAAAVELLHRAGVPPAVLQFLPGDGGVGAALVADPRVDGVAFTGSTDTAWAINRSLAARAAAIGTLIAETGGQNAMLVDSSALLEQVVADVLASGFQSAGQRCSALRILLVQEEVAPRLLEMLAGAMAELRIGDPADLATDVGPVIDADALARLDAHAARLEREARPIYRCRLPEACAHGSFFAPRAYEIDRVERLRGEVFGPVLHVLRYRARELDAAIDAVNATGYGLTFGIHSRIDATVERVLARVRAGNVYVNRNMIGAVVGVQPFGGVGLSGTGPKAGGPHYLPRFASERSVSIDTTAAGGNASLLSLDDA